MVFERAQCRVVARLVDKVLGDGIGAFGYAVTIEIVADGKRYVCRKIRGIITQQVAPVIGVAFAEHGSAKPLDILGLRIEAQPLCGHRRWEIAHMHLHEVVHRMTYQCVVHAKVRNDLGAFFGHLLGFRVEPLLQNGLRHRHIMPDEPLNVRVRIANFSTNRGKIGALFVQVAECPEQAGTLRLRLARPERSQWIVFVVEVLQHRLGERLLLTQIVLEQERGGGLG